MSKTPKLLLIDGNNLCFREHFSKKNLSHKGRAVDVIYGVFKSLISLHKKYPDHFRIIAWEGGYDRRLRESREAVEAGLIPESYKQNRREKEEDEDLETLFEQKDTLKEMLQRTRTMQVKVDGYEADDVINTYADWTQRHGGEAVIVSSDHDFFQCLRNNTKMYDPYKQETWTEERLREECGFPPELWLDKSAIEGEVGQSKDNIFGVEGWGPVKAAQYVAEYGDIESIIKALHEKEKRGKREESFLQQVDKLRLSKSLKRMDVIPDIPMPRVFHQASEEDVKQMFMEWGFASIKKEAWRMA